MKIIEFPVEQKELHKYILYKIDQQHNVYSNGLYNLLKFGYSYHIPISIRPDDILNNVACVWSKYIKVNAEKFRSFFVQHEDKKELIYCSTGFYSQNRMPEFMNGLLEFIRLDQLNDSISWLDQKFTTSLNVDSFIRSTAILSSQKEYYEYGCVLCCGFPKITLLGTDSDWNKLLYSILMMPCPDDYLKLWKDTLTYTVCRMMDGSELFWQSCLTAYPYGSGGQKKINGWITTFNPINEGGKWLEKIDEVDVLNLDVDFDLKVNDNGKDFTCKVHAGPTSFIIENNELSVNNTYSITEAVV